MKHNPVSSFVFFMAILSGCLLLLYGPIVFGDSTLYFRDVLHNYYPLITFLKNSFWRGDLPLWNPYLFTGNPQMAGLEPPVFYPLAWMFLFFSYKYALALNLILHHLLAAGGIYLLGRAYDWRWTARLLAAMLFTLGGVMVSMNNLHPLQNAAAWIPLLFWATHCICTQRSLRYVLGFALFYALQILSGHLEIVYFSSLAVGIYAFLFVSKSSWKILVYLAGAVVLGILLSALQVLPSLAYSALSIRQHGLDAQSAMIWSFHPLLSLMFIVPESHGNVLSGLSLNMLFGEKQFGHALLFTSSYMGLTGLMGFLLALWAWYLQPECRRWMGYWIVLTLVAILLAFGQFTPLYNGFLQLPGASFFRYPAKFLIFVSLALSVTAGFGLNAALIEKSLGKAMQRAAGGLLLLFGFTAIGIRVFSADLAHQFAELAQVLRSLPPESALSWSRSLTALFQEQFSRQALLCLLLLVCFGLCARLALKIQVVLAVLVLVTASDLTMSGINAVWLISDDIFALPAPSAALLKQLGLSKDPQARFIQANDILQIPPSFRPDLQQYLYVAPSLLQMAVLEDNLSLVHGFRNTYGFWPARTRQADVLGVLYEQMRGDETTAFRHIYESIQATRYIQAINPPAALLQTYLASPDYKQLAYFPEHQTYVFENLSYLPRARFQYQAMTVQDEKQMTSIFANPGIAGFDYRQQVILLDSPALKQAREQVPSQEAVKKQWSPPQIVHESNNRLEIQFETNTSGYLVLADQYAPGWEAWVNGVKAPIIRANFMQRAVRVGPGQHRVEMRYAAPGFALGLWLSGLAGLCWLCLFAFSLRQRPRSEAVDTTEPLPLGV
ncbi:MAG: YfhO family protein [Candidatus Sericytochromatia bacterium]